MVLREPCWRFCKPLVSHDPSKTLELNSLREKIESFQLDEPGAALPFTSRLAREQGWNHAFAGRVVAEYLRFIHLAMTAGHPVTPSEATDQAWHLYLIYTRSYWELAKLRLEQDRRPDHQADPADAICWNLALVGPIVLAGIPEFSGMHRDLEKQMGGAASGSSSGGCGTSSSGCGGGGSGCGGGGGCGGCGGGGD